MSIRRLKTYELTCDGWISWKGVAAACVETTIVQATGKGEVLFDLAHAKEGEWHSKYGEVRCPNDHGRGT